MQDRTDLFFSTALLTMSFSFFLNWILIKYYAIPGAIAATIFSYLILVILLYRNGKKITKIEWPINKIVISSFIAILLIVMVSYVTGYYPNYSFYIKCLGFIFYIIVSVFMKLIGKKEINGFRSLWNSIFKEIKA